MRLFKRLNLRILGWLLLSSPVVSLPKAQADHFKNLSPERLEVSTSDHARRRATFEARFKWVHETEVKVWPRFGCHPGSKSPHKVFTSISFVLSGQRKVNFPNEAFYDLANPLLLSKPTMIEMRGDTLLLNFDGGGGERFYQATFEWDRRTGTLTRVIERQFFGVWKKSWKLTKGKWQRFEDRYSKVED